MFQIIQIKLNKQAAGSHAKNLNFLMKTLLKIIEYIKDNTNQAQFHLKKTLVVKKKTSFHQQIQKMLFTCRNTCRNYLHQPKQHPNPVVPKS
jgi:hypothetical protein